MTKFLLVLKGVQMPIRLWRVGPRRQCLRADHGRSQVARSAELDRSPEQFGKTIRREQGLARAAGEDPAAFQIDNVGYRRDDLLNLMSHEDEGGSCVSHAVHQLHEAPSGDEV